MGTITLPVQGTRLSDLGNDTRLCAEELVLHLFTLSIRDPWDDLLAFKGMDPRTRFGLGSDITSSEPRSLAYASYWEYSAACASRRSIALWRKRLATERRDTSCSSWHLTAGCGMLRQVGALHSYTFIRVLIFYSTSPLFIRHVLYHAGIFFRHQTYDTKERYSNAFCCLVFLRWSYLWLAFQHCAILPLRHRRTIRVER